VAPVIAFAVMACTAQPVPSPSPTPFVAVTTAPTATPAHTPIPTPSPPTLSDDQILRLYCCSTDVRSLRPQAASGSDEISIIGGVQRGLLYRDGEGKLVPSLATHLPTVSQDLLTYTYTLRDAQYSDGTPIVAADIVRAARALADPRNAFDYGYEMCHLAGADDLLGSDFGCSTDKRAPYKNVARCDADPSLCSFDDEVIDGLLAQLGVMAPDDHTVVFQLRQPTSFWPDITATWLLTPVPPTASSWAEASDIVSSGPFVLSEWTHNHSMLLTPNPNWYGTTPTLQRIEISIGGDPGAAVVAWKAGNLDEVPVPSALLGQVLGTPGQVLGSPDYAPMIRRTNTLSLEYWDFANCGATDSSGEPICPDNEAVTKGVVGKSPMQNVHFRRALTQSIDKADLIEQAFAGIGVAAYSPTMPGIPRFPTVTARDTPLPFDPAAARAEMNTALGELGVAQPDAADVKPATEDCDDPCQHTMAWGRQLGPMRFNYNCDAGHDVRVMYLAEHWRQVLGFSGTQLDTRCVDFGLFPTPRRSATTWADVAREGWGADFPHPDNQNRGLFNCGGWHNGSNYCNPAYDALLDQGATAASYEESLSFYHQAEELLAKDAPVLFLRYGETNSLVRPWVVYTPSLMDQQNVGDAFYENYAIAAH
jgi:oligopeptide transport system substrate-binding protein